MRTHMPACNHWRHLSPNNQRDIHGDAKRGKPRDRLTIHNPGIIDVVAMRAACGISTPNQLGLAEALLTLWDVAGPYAAIHRRAFHHSSSFNGHMMKWRHDGLSSGGQKWHKINKDDIKTTTGRHGKINHFTRKHQTCNTLFLTCGCLY